MKKIKAILRRVNKIKDKLVHWSACLNLKVYARKRYIWYREHCRLRKKWILLESLPGGQPQDNIAVMLMHLATAPEYRGYRIFLAGSPEVLKERKDYLKRKEFARRVTLLSMETLPYYRILATAKYLITDDAFIYLFIKRQGQIYLNVWHGTPWMTLGKNKKKECAMLGNEQKNFLDADYLVCQNEFTVQCFLEDYMLSNFCKTKLLLTGYPRNELLLQAKEKTATEEQCIVYMPTWRNYTKERSKKAHTQEVMQLLSAWDAALSEGQTVYMKQHHINSLELNFEKFCHIRPFPQEKSTYEVLAGADVLVTDYSSVMFDFALTGRKIILFHYDEAYYAATRGFHRELSELPFAKAETIEELVQKIHEPKQYDDTAFLREFCAYDRIGVTESLCRKVILGEKCPEIKEQEIPDNGKENIVLYIGSFAKNGLTTSAVNLLRTIDRTKYNFAVVYYMLGLKKRQEDILVLPENVARFGFYFHRSMTYTEYARYMFWKEFKRVPYSWVRRGTERMAGREAERMFSGLRIDTAIQFAGYDDEMTVTMSKLPCNRVIFAHNDMEQEIKTRQNADRELLGYAYNAFDHVAVVTEDILPPARRIADAMQQKKENPANIVVCNNIIDVERIRSMGEQELRFDADTEFYPSKGKLLTLLNSDKKKFVTVGRFSVEKGHARLIRAFETLHKEAPDTCLIIIGGHGKLWEETKNRAKKSPCANNIVLVQHMSNPYALMKLCDYFAFSSFYEGFGLVLVEADILGLPCFSPEVIGPTGFMKRYGGLLVENSEKGILEGMKACLNKAVPERLSIDYEQYNKETVLKFEALFQKNSYKK